MEHFRAILHSIRHFYKKTQTFTVRVYGLDAWAGSVCECGKAFGQGLYWKGLMDSIVGPPR